MLALAGLDLSEQRFSAALERYQMIAQSTGGRWQFQASAGLAQTRAARARFWAMLAIATATGLVTAWRALRVGTRGWWPLPEELFIALPVAALLALLSLAQPSPEARAVQILVAGGVCLLWVNATYHRAVGRAGLGRVVEASIGLAEATGLLFFAVQSAGLWNRLLETMAGGAE